MPPQEIKAEIELGFGLNRIEVGFGVQRLADHGVGRWYPRLEQADDLLARLRVVRQFNPEPVDLRAPARRRPLEMPSPYPREIRGPPTRTPEILSRQVWASPDRP